MTNTPIPEARIREILTDFLVLDSLDEYPDFTTLRIPKDDFHDTTHTLSVIPAPTASPGTIILAAYEVSDPSVEVARFAVRIDVRKIPVPGAPPATIGPILPTLGGRPLETVDALDAAPVDPQPPIASIPVTAVIWMEGTWGPRKLDGGGHSYDHTPVSGDIIKTPTGMEWVVVGALSPANPTTVTVRSLDGTKTLEQTPPKGWDHPVTFRRGERGAATALLATHLGATEIQPSGGRARRSA